MNGPRLIIGHGNGHNKPSLVDYVRDADADSFGLNEAQKLGDRLTALPGKRVIGYSEGWNEPRNRANASAIVTDNRHPSLGTFERQVSERIEAVERFAPDRVLRASFFEHPLATALDREGIAHWELHPDATMMPRRPDHPIVREYREALESTGRWMRGASRDGLVNVLTGDLQATRGFNAAYGPRALLAEPLGLSYRVVRIDWIMADPLLRFVGTVRRRHLFDHTGFVATLAAR